MVTEKIPHRSHTTAAILRNETLRRYPDNMGVLAGASDVDTTQKKTSCGLDSHGKAIAATDAISLQKKTVDKNCVDHWSLDAA